MRDKLKRIVGGDKLILLAATAVVFALFTVLNRNFLSWMNFVNSLVASSLVGLVAIGQSRALRRAMGVLTLPSSPYSTHRPS